MVDRVDETLKADIVHWAAFYELRMRAGNKKIYHLEALYVSQRFLAFFAIYPARTDLALIVFLLVGSF